MFKKGQIVWCLAHGKGIVEVVDIIDGYLLVKFDKCPSHNVSGKIPYTIDGKMRPSCNQTLFDFEPQVIHKVEPIVIPHEDDIISADEVDLRQELHDVEATVNIEDDALSVIHKLAKEPLIQQMVAMEHKLNNNGIPNTL